MATSSVPGRDTSRRCPPLRALLLLAVAGVSLGGCTQIDNALAAVPIFSFLREAPFFDPYEMPLPPPPGAVPFQSPVGVLLPPQDATEAALNAFAASPEGRNPLAAGDADALRLGRVMYERHCAVCHGPTGAANGPVVGPGKFPPLVPTLLAPPATTRTDGYVYAIIRAGRGMMPSYGARITHTERWAIVNYVRQLQSAAAPVGAP